jgi:hypothetical protein
MSGAKRRTPPVVVRAPRIASLTAENREQVVTALTAMIYQWWSARAAAPMPTVHRHDVAVAGDR